MVRSLPKLPISTQQISRITITSRRSEQNGFAIKNLAALVSTASSIQRMVPIFPLVITSLICGRQQWYTQFPKIITGLLTIFSSRVKNLLHSRHPQIIHYLEPCLTTNLVCSAPLLEHCLQARNTNTSPTSVINFNIPPEVVNLLRPVPATPDATNAIAPRPSIILDMPVAQPVFTGTTGMLIPGDRMPGPDMPLAEFCLAHCLTDGVRNKLEENGYSRSHTFQYAQWEELRKAGLKAGKIAQLKHAIVTWSILRNV